MSWENFYVMFWSIAVVVGCLIIIAAVAAVAYGVYWLVNLIS